MYTVNWPQARYGNPPVFPIWGNHWNVRYLDFFTFFFAREEEFFG